LGRDTVLQLARDDLVVLLGCTRTSSNLWKEWKEGCT